MFENEYLLMRRIAHVNIYCQYTDTLRLCTHQKTLAIPNKTETWQAACLTRLLHMHIDKGVPDLLGSIVLLILSSSTIYKTDDARPPS